MTDGQIRASDAERDEVAERLRLAYAEGRLDVAEFNGRLGATLAARTRGELAAPLRDLPAPPARPIAPALEHRRTSGPACVGDQPVGRQWAAYAAVNTVCLLVWLATSVVAGDALFFWPLFVLVPWGLALTGRTLGGRRGTAPAVSDAARPRLRR